MTLEQLLWLVPRFSEGLLRSLLAAPAIEVQIASAEMGSNIIDPHCPGVDILIQGLRITGALTDSGSGLNVITTNTCQKLGLMDRTKCPFWLRMVDGSSVKPEGLMHNLTIIIEGYSSKSRQWS